MSSRTSTAFRRASQKPVNAAVASRLAHVLKHAEPVHPVQSAKEAGSKSEAATNEQIRQQATVLSATRDALAAQIGELRDRVTRNEGQDKGWGMAGGLILGIAGLAIAAVALLVGFLR